MCWNWEVSLLFAVVESVCIVLALTFVWNYPAYYVKKNRKEAPFYIKLHRSRVLWMLPFMLTINIVEWSEVGIWFSSPSSITDLISDQSSACSACSSGNFYFTTLAGFAIGFQPFFTVLFLYKSHLNSKFHIVLCNPEENKVEEDLESEEIEHSPRFPEPDCDFVTEMQRPKVAVEKYLGDNNAQEILFRQSKDTFRVVYAFAFIFTIASLLVWAAMSLFSSFPRCDYDPTVFATMAAACTCSYEGTYGHLVWTFMFPCKIREYLPTIFDYLLLSNIAPFFYGPCWAAMPMIGSFIFFMMEMVYYLGSPEVYSVWCWTGAGAIGLYVCYALMLYDERLLAKLESTGMNGSCFEVGYMFYHGAAHALRTSKQVQDFIAIVKRKLRRFIFLR